jgi:hypothetical protein
MPTLLRQGEGDNQRTVAPVTEEYIEDGRPHVLQDKLLPPDVLVLRIHGPFLFRGDGEAVRGHSRCY